MAERGPADHHRPLVVRPGPDFDRIAAQGSDPAEQAQWLFPGLRGRRPESDGGDGHESFSHGSICGLIISEETLHRAMPRADNGYGKLRHCRLNTRLSFD